MKIKKPAFSTIIHLLIIILASLFLYIGNRIAVEGMTISYYINYPVAEAKVLEITEINKSELVEGVFETEVIFLAEITNGEYKKTEVLSKQYQRSDALVSYKLAEAGDKVTLTFINGKWLYKGPLMIDKIFVLGIIFVALLLFFCRSKGLNAILSLGFTCVAVFAVFVPAILSGKNIYFSTVVVCLYSVVVTLFIIYGINIKSIAAVTGCFGGVIAACLCTLFMNNALNLTGMLDEESRYVLYLTAENRIDLKAIVFAGIVIGAVGAIIDVAVSMSSALWELKEQAPELKRSDILKSGMNIGKDIIGATTNTLVLAYVGGSLSSILLLLVYTGSLTDLLNRELVVVEILQALIGSLGILLTMPLTALICAVLYSKKPKAK